MITITFKHSKSAKINHILNLSKKFIGFEICDHAYRITFDLKEIFEKWEWVNEIYWTAISWKGTTVEYDDMVYHSTKDQRMLFYALQQAKYNQINNVAYKLVQMYRRYTGKELYDVRLQGISDEIMDNLLDSINDIKRRLK